MLLEHICFSQYTSSQFGTSGRGREKQDRSHTYALFKGILK